MMAADLRTTIPPPHPQDNDDVRWALSTATALWSSGACEDALKWLRRAGETASEYDDDLRAVELFKAAAVIRTSMLPPPPEPGVSDPVSEVRTRLDPRLVTLSPPITSDSSPATDSSPTPRMRSQLDTSLGLGVAGKNGAIGGGPHVAISPAQRQTQIGLGAVRVSRSTPSSIKMSSTRFVVVPGSQRGELTLKALASDAEPPSGVAVAVVVPRSVRDAELIDRILEAGAGFFDLHHDDQPTHPGAGGERTRQVG